MSDRVAVEETAITPDIKMRLASITDLETLVYICRVCFPEEYRWKSILPLAKQWWRIVLESKASQTWVVEDSKGIFAFRTVVLDLELWKAESKRRNGSRMFRMTATLCCPFAAVWKRLWKTAVVLLTDKRPTRYRSPAKSFERIAWGERIGVLPRLRRAGVSSLLLRASNEKIREAGATAIETHIDADNTPARRNVEKNGYILVSEGPRGCLYRKSLIDSK